MFLDPLERRRPRHIAIIESFEYISGGRGWEALKSKSPINPTEQTGGDARQIGSPTEGRGGRDEEKRNFRVEDEWVDRVDALEKESPRQCRDDYC